MHGVEGGEVELLCMEGDSGARNRFGVRATADMLLETGNGVFAFLYRAGCDDELQGLGGRSGGEEFVGQSAARSKAYSAEMVRWSA